MYFIIKLKLSLNYKSYTVFIFIFHIYSIKRIAIRPWKLRVTFKTDLSILSNYKFKIYYAILLIQISDLELFMLITTNNSKALVVHKL